MTCKNHTIKTLCFLLLSASAWYQPTCQAEISGDFLIFPQLDAVFRSDLNDDSTLEKDDYDAGVDLFATLEIGNFRFLGEFQLSTHHQHFERLQFGWSTKSHLIWVGRFHNPIGYWNTRYHHGAHLQTSISRPAIVEFEDNGGILPIHQGGLLVEGSFSIGERGLGYALTFGAGPDYTDKLKPWKILEPGSGAHEPSATLNLFRDSQSENPGRLGLFANYTEIPADSIGVDEIQQISTGLYGDREYKRWRWHGTIFYVHNQLKRPTGSEGSTFFNAFLQTEFELNNRWTLYSRIEGTVGNDDDAYLALFPNFVEDRILGGLRYDFTDAIALKLEASANHMQEDNYTKVMLQLSALF